MFYFAIQVATTHARAASTLEGGRPHSSNLTTTAIRPFPITGGWRAWRRINSMSSASLAAAVDVAIPSTNYYASSTSPTSPPRMKTNDQQALSTTPSRRQRQQQSTGLTRPIKMSGRQSLQQKGAKTEGKYTMGKESDALFGEAEVNTSGCVGILFLAHDGVANPSLWEKWRESDPVSRAPGKEWEGRLAFQALSHAARCKPSHHLTCVPSRPIIFRRSHPASDFSFSGTKPSATPAPLPTKTTYFCACGPSGAVPV